ncbi:hypothetical protein ACLKA6_002665 [Drosophila palustris]
MKKLQYTCSLQLCCFGWAHPEEVGQYEKCAPFLELVMVELRPTLLRAERQQIVERTFEELPHWQRNKAFREAGRPAATSGARR